MRYNSSVKCARTGIGYCVEPLKNLRLLPLCQLAPKAVQHCTTELKLDAYSSRRQQKRAHLSVSLSRPPAEGGLFGGRDWNRTNDPHYAKVIIQHP